MRFILSIIVVFFSSVILNASELPPASVKAIDDAVAAAIAKAETPGAVVLVVHKGDVVFRQAYGQRAIKPVPEAMTPDTIFDMASLTKPVATGTSIWKLFEQGKLKPTDLVSTHWPEFAANGKDKVTIAHCLLHTTGLTADNSINDYAGTKPESLAKIAALPLEVPAGTRFKYSDVGFIVLGHLVEKLSGQPVEVFATENVFKPLGMKNTGTAPKDERKSRVAPTGLRNKEIIRGEVHDPRAYRLGGFAGHAGLFSTADDMAIYASMLLNGGELNGKRILAAETVKLFTTGHAVPPSGSRSYGWDVDTGFSGQRGELFRAGEGYGHTGFTGTSLWVDPASQTAIIILANRVHPNDKGNMSPLRKQIATIVASAVTGKAIPAKKTKPVKTGIDVLAEQNFAMLKGKKVGLVTNHTGLALDGTATIDLIAKAEGVNLVALFSPEHGIRGELDEKVSDGKDAKTGKPIYSLYGERRKPTPEQLKGIDVLVYDIQDIGCRFYTYISTLGLVLEAASEQKIPVVVLDRPNPLGGIGIEGPMLDEGRGTFVGYHSLPLRHGLTVGELARMFVSERKLTVDLQVVKVENWQRGQTFEQTGLSWKNPSPNMRHLTAARLYPGIGMLETTNISVGRGTERPFEWFGAPWINGRDLAQDLNALQLPGVAFIPCSRTPVSSVHKDKVCGGVDIVLNDAASLKAVELGIHVARALRTRYPGDWDTKRLDTLLLHKDTLEKIRSGTTTEEIVKNWQNGLELYQTRRQKFFLYPE